MITRKKISKTRGRRNLFQLYLSMQEEKCQSEGRDQDDVYVDSPHGIHSNHQTAVHSRENAHIMHLEKQVKIKLEEQSSLLSIKGIDRVDIQQKKGKHSIICIHYIKNMCMKNLFCNYLHQLIYAKIPACKNFLKNNYCADKVRGSCMFRHTQDNVNSGGFGESKDEHLDDVLKLLYDKNICVNYLLGFCNLGYNCKRVHKCKSRKFINLISILPKFYLDNILVNHSLYGQLYSNQRKLSSDMNKLKDALIILSGEKYQEKTPLSATSSNLKNDKEIFPTDDTSLRNSDHQHLQQHQRGINSDTQRYRGGGLSLQKDDQNDRPEGGGSYPNGSNAQSNARYYHSKVGGSGGTDNFEDYVHPGDKITMASRDNEKGFTNNRVGTNAEKRNQENVMTIPNIYDINNNIIPSEKIKIFIIKCNQISHLYLSILYGVWATGKNNTRKFINLFKENYTIVFLFSVNESGGFQGYAKMVTVPIKNLYENLWGPISNRLGGNFRIQWIKIAKIDFDAFRNMRNPCNDNLPLKKSRDGTELPLNLASIICNRIYALPSEDFLAGTIYEYKRRINHAAFFLNLHKQGLLNSNTVWDMRIYCLNKQSDCERITFIDGTEQAIG
ncbi:YTH domain-containing protein, putative [Plasmodium knowlesi strain H]|uniref:YTH domain-containing protein, putative n=3 Tax=Plasmodium knowlesi TaxID=5850 RepID=A0A5K1U0S5_PLAKH|nr:YTH domain-containing protein 1, putative [Plasmodium knowlesi strain H]OTN67780.1 putative YT521-B-like family protein [Plasmodium knowlesi]CAA9990411.1 YTH domain-containing protein 1, putative [Plasmodium knowlesi strain H]SBO19617.1 YTH domain-containing protein, putative [Plasmodium knowlesi strain H]SBO22595.1 YTH domain-containing protein, putative [Plasmodium knowlesi strain H]VVS79885.1 YTH domain-containing protein 1, putative [Plasmodium knowlesi strain H]|eukprot:XP_002260811.1 YT521-B-like family protein, putative [Plasmodium knowlesi strain H]